MLKKSPSKTSRAFKYAMLLPVLIGILCYTSCESNQATPSPEIEEVAEQPLNTLSFEQQKRELINQIQANEVLTEEEKNSLIQGIKQSQGKLDFKEDARAIVGEKDVPLAVIEQVPVFPGCESAEDKRACFVDRITTHVKKHFSYPEEAQKQGIEGNVSLMFTIGKDGKITKILTRGPSPLLEEEARRIIGKLPQMQPGMEKGNAVNVPFAIPITFKLN